MMKSKMKLDIIGVAQLDKWLHSTRAAICSRWGKMIKQQSMPTLIRPDGQCIPLTPRWLSNYARGPMSRNRICRHRETPAISIASGPRRDVLNVTVWDHPELTTPAGQYHRGSRAYYPATGFSRTHQRIPTLASVSVVGKILSEIAAILPGV